MEKLETAYPETIMAQRCSSDQSASLSSSNLNKSVNVGVTEIVSIGSKPSTADQQPAPLKQQESYWWQIRSYLPDTKWTILFTSTLALQAVLCVIIECFIYFRYEESVRLLTHVKYSGYLDREFGPTQLAIAIFEALLQIILSMQAARYRNIVQAVGICFNNLSICIMLLLGMLQLKDNFSWTVYLAWRPGASGPLNPPSFPVSRLLDGLFVIFSVETIVLSFITWKLLGEFSWAVYRHLPAADMVVRRRYLHHEIYLAILYLDFLFLLGFWIQLIPVAWYMQEDGFSRMSFGVVLTGISLTPLSLLLSGFSAKKESILGGTGAIALMLLSLAMVGTLAYETHLEFAVHFGNTGMAVRICVYAAIAVALILTTIVICVVNMRHYGKGMKPYINRNKVQAGDISVVIWKNESGGSMDVEALPHPGRMEIE